MSALNLLTVCTANQARSPLAEAMSRRWLDEHGVDATVRSAGTHAEWGYGPTAAAEETARRLGLDISNHSSRPLEVSVVAGVDLVLTMERLHSLEVWHHHHDLIDVTFTVVEFADLAADHPRVAGETVGDWIAARSADRSMSQMLSLTHARDIGDPVGRSLRRHRRTAAKISHGLEVTLRALFPNAVAQE